MHQALERLGLSSLFVTFAGALVQAQGGFDYIGPDDSLSTGNNLFLSQDRTNGQSGVTAQPWTPTSSSLPREIWVVWSGANQQPAQVGAWRVGIWTSRDAVILSPDAGDVLALTLGAPDLGDPSTPFGTTADGRDTYRFGFTIAAPSLAAGAEYHFGVQAVQDPALNGIGGVVESSVAQPSGTQVDPTVPGGSALVADLAESQHSGALAYRVVADTADFVFCAGDGTASPCPCGNTGAAHHGCANSAFAQGAQLLVSGTPSVSLDSVQLHVTSSRPSQPGLFFQGDNAIANGDGIPFGDGLRCAGSNVVRLQVASANAAGAVSTTIAIGSVGGVSAGEVKRYQWWYRDPGASPCGFDFNLSNGIVQTWVP